MKLIDPNEYLLLREELNEFVTLCNRYNYTPSKDEFDDVIRFILLQQGGGASHLCESYELNPFKLLNNLYESFEFDESNYIDEAGTGSIYEPEKDFDSAVGSVTTGAKMAVAGAAITAVAVGVYIAYLFKKSKVKKAVNKEKDAEIKKLEGFAKLSELKKKLKSLDPKASTKIKLPGSTKGEAKPAAKTPEKPEAKPKPDKKK
jgi:hypothetical protein